MKLIGTSCVMAGLVGLLLTGCHKPTAQTEETDSSAPGLATTAAPSQSATLSVPAASVRPPQPEYAPRGVFYLLVSVQKTTPDGIIRLLPGTEVKLQANGKYLTPEGEMALDLKILTNDMALARAARNADKLAQTANLPKGLPATPAAPLPSAAPTAPTASAAPSVTAALQTILPTTATQAGTAPVDDASARALKFRLSTLRSEEEKLQANLNYLQDKVMLRPHAGPPSGLSGSTNVRDWDLIVTKLSAVQAEIQTVEAKLGSLPY